MPRHQVLPDCHAVRAEAMFDGFSVSGPVTVHVRRGRIVAVDRTGSVPQDTHVIDLGADVCLLPGLVESGLHLSFDASTHPVASLVAEDDDQVLTRMRAAAHEALLAGITTARDLGDRNFLSLTLADETLRAPHLGPEILASGPPITTPGGQCHFLGGAVSGEAALIEAVRERHARGCAVVGILASGGAMTYGSRAHLPQFSVTELRTVVEEAHRLGLPVAAHAHATTSIRDALAAGVDILGYVSFWEEWGVTRDLELMARIAGSGTFVGLPLGRRGEPVRTGFDGLALRADGIRAASGSLVRLGARVVVTSGGGVAPHKPHNVLPYSAGELVELGMTPLESLKAITSEAAAACGVEGRKGRIQAGADADFLAVAGDPLRDLGALHDVHAVFRAGVRIR
ncbi:amidohydrolase family protein [Streptomyces sp. NPDC046977]|uniref:amidohydrolase family protein n=1 Tax=Streptomyces sp. NPDC046977 TaxID=3154703 RepID=UPI0033D1B48B